MYEEYYGFTEKPFSLTPDPKYLFKSESHANAFELLQYAVRRREGFVVVSGDIGTGKTTLCRAFLEQIDRNTFTALVLNPFLSEEDLLKLNLNTLLKAPQMRQLDQRVSIRYQLKPLTREEVAAYVSHRVSIAGGSSVVSFQPKALDLLHRRSEGIPRLVNLLCDRALLAAY